MTIEKSNMILNGWRSRYRRPLALTILVLALALTLVPSAVQGMAAPGSEATVATAGATTGRTPNIADVSVASVDGALTVDANGDDDHHMWGGWWNGGWWIVMAILMVLFWATVIGVVIWAITHLTREGRRDGDRALDIAQERYARGEISRDEFEQIRRDLR